ncbi:hypothetical protein AYI70_g7679 [Smittium culicis]|uniref:Uncharacterized protein n=1 Tax=Smittium culicis TaxID=133412 RepID=A0A1R1XJH8_9FUNG|nr:hypothetical protein AYI70_g7679 [Smittium culicis]
MLFWKHQLESWNGLSFLPDNPDCGFQALFRINDSFSDVDAHQRKIIVNCIVRTLAPKCCWSFSSNILTQYYDVGLRQKIWGNEFSRIAEDFRTDMEPLLGNEYPSSSYICTNYNESSRCTQQTHGTDGVVAIRTSVRTDHEPVWDTRCASIRIEGEQENSEILQLVPRQMEQPLLLPSLESDLPSNSESETGTANYHIGYTSIENLYMEPRSLEIINRTATAVTSNKGDTRT